MATVGEVFNMQTNQLCLTLINLDIHYDPVKVPQTAIDYHYGDTISRQGNYSIGSWADDILHESYALYTELPEMRSDEYDEDYRTEKSIEYHGLTMDDRGLLHTTSADVTSTSIDSRPTPSIDSRNNPSIVVCYKHLSEEDMNNNNTDYDLIPGEFGIFIDSAGRARGMHGKFAARPAIDRRPLSSVDGLVAPEQNSYSKVEIDVLVAEIYRVIRTSDDFHSKRLDDIYYPFDNRISWLTTSMDEMKQNLAMLQKQLEVSKGRSKSIDTHNHSSIEDRLQSFIYQLEGVYYLLRDGVDFLTTRLDVLQQEMVMIQRQLDSQAEPSPSIYRRTHPSIDGDYTTRRSKLVTEKSLQDKLDEITFSQDFLKEDVYQELKNISETTYARF
uniref:Uncharacterized protein n=1 Tax=Brassica campestris TaxID=3711 RepID=A0A3P6BQK4_BRACM|nr:unnamed protein product [Brassica rapa]